MRVKRGGWRRGRSRQPDPVAVAGMLASLGKVLLVVDSVSPQQRGAVPLIGEMAIDGGTRVLGVGQYSISAARGEPMVVQDE